MLIDAYDKLKFSLLIKCYKAFLQGFYQMNSSFVFCNITISILYERGKVPYDLRKLWSRCERRK